MASRTILSQTVSREVDYEVRQTDRDDVLQISLHKPPQSPKTMERGDSCGSGDGGSQEEEELGPEEILKSEAQLPIT